MLTHLVCHHTLTYQSSTVEGGGASAELALAAWSATDLRLDLLLRWHSRIAMAEAEDFSGLLAVLLPDADFKAALMECCVRQHAQMMQDHVACVGPASGKLLSSLTVQLYTVPSLVRAAGASHTTVTFRANPSHNLTRSP